MEFQIGDKVICIDKSGYQHLKIGKQYEIFKLLGTRLCEITTDYNVYSINQFQLDKKYYRKQKLKQLRNGI